MQDLQRLIDERAPLLRVPPLGPQGAVLRPALPPNVELYLPPVPSQPLTFTARLAAPSAMRELPNASASRAQPAPVPTVHLDLPRETPPAPPGAGNVSHAR